MSINRALAQSSGVKIVIENTAGPIVSFDQKDGFRSCRSSSGSCCQTCWTGSDHSNGKSGVRHQFSEYQYFFS